MLLLIPLKTTTHIDLVTHLSQWVENSHPRYSASAVINEIKRLHALRADINRTICNTTSHSYAYDKNNTISDLIEYHACLVACTERGFPNSARDAKVNGTVDAHLQFSWKNALDKHEESALTEETKSHFNYEIACVLWNIAALKSYTASSVHDWSSKEGLTLVKKDYQMSALIFKHIREVLEEASTKSNAITSDLTDASLDMCKYLCLAQGQVCLYEVLKQKLNASSSTGAYTLIAQIAIGTADLYDKALKASQETIIKFNESSKIYGAHFKSLSMLFKARAEYLQSIVERKSGEHGVEITRLKRCQEMTREAIDFTKSNGKQSAKIVVGPSSLGKSALDTLKSLRVTIKQRLNDVVKENATIYHEKIPDDAMLQKIEGKDMISASILGGLPDEFLSLVRPMFASCE